MNNTSRDRSHPTHKLEQEIVKTAPNHLVISDIQKLVIQYAMDFDLGVLSLYYNQQQNTIPLSRAIAELYNKTRLEFRENNIEFDDHWHWILPWREAISFENLTKLTKNNINTLISSFHPKSHNALTTIFNNGLERYMRWYPWRWFSDLVFIGAGGFSALYAANVTLPYDFPEQDKGFGHQKRTVALKIVDEKILNEITVQSKAFVALLFHGMTVCESTGDLMVILTLAENGNLNRQIEMTNTTSFLKITKIVSTLAFKLASLHDEIGLCHRNIHPENVIHDDDDYFLVDFRFSTASDEATKVTRESQVHYGRVPYIAPEVQQGIYTEKSDVYSLGVIMWQLVSGIIFPTPEIIQTAPDVYRIEWVPGVNRWYQEITMACLEPLPENRPTAEEIALLLGKIIATTHKSDTADEGWRAYVNSRRQKCKAHLNQFVVENPCSASRVYTLNEFSNTCLVNNIPFHHRPFDPDTIAFNIESNNKD